MRAGKCGRWHAKGKKEPRKAAVGRDSVPTAAFLGSTYAGMEKKGALSATGRPSGDTCGLEVYFLIQENMERIFSPVTSMG